MLVRYICWLIFISSIGHIFIWLVVIIRQLYVFFFVDQIGIIVAYLLFFGCVVRIVVLINERRLALLNKSPFECLGAIFHD